MRIGLLGSRGIPARYSGFETFYEQLAIRLVERGHEVTVYNRSHFIRDVKGEYQGVRIVSLPSVRTKHLDTISHTLLSSIHSLFQGYDIVYYCIVGNSPLVWIPRLARACTLLNVDGEDWAREKWSGFARWYQKQCRQYWDSTLFILSFIPQDIVGTDTTQLDHTFIEAQSQPISLTDADLEFVRSAHFFQPQGRMAEILEQHAQLFIDAFPDLDGQSPVIPEKGVCSSNDHCAGPS
jgi:glycosyltransferase involved in cell wall biosynthesis